MLIPRKSSQPNLLIQAPIEAINAMQSESPMRCEGGENSFARESQYRASGGGGRDSSFARNHAYGGFGPSYLSG